MIGFTITDIGVIEADGTGMGMGTGTDTGAN